MEFDSIFKIMDIFVNYNKHKAILEQTEENIKSAKTEEEVNCTVNKSKNEIYCWYTKVICKSILIFIIFAIILTIIIFSIKDIMIILPSVITLIFCEICVLAYIIDKLQNKEFTINELYRRITDIAIKYGIHVEEIFTY